MANATAVKAVEQMVVLHITCDRCTETKVRQKTYSIDHQFFDDVEAGKWIQSDGFNEKEVPEFMSVNHICDCCKY